MVSLLSPQQQRWLAVSLVKGITARGLYQLWKRFGSLEALLSASDAQLCARNRRMTPALARKMRRAEEQPQFQAELELLAAQKVRLVTLDDAAYPPLLKEIPTPPPLLYHYGELPHDAELMLGVVGTRDCSVPARRWTRRLIQSIAKKAPQTVIVSGLALGIDAVAHEAALEYGLRTLAVLGCGLKRVYPRENLELARQLLRRKNAIVSGFSMETPPQRYNFPIRNRIIAGLSHGVVVAEAPLRSGALITGHLALEYNREVFAFPGDVDRAEAMGSNRLIQRGEAKLLQEVEDLLCEFDFDTAFEATQNGVPARLAEEVAAEGTKSSPRGSPRTEDEEARGLREHEAMPDLSRPQQQLLSLLGEAASSLDDLAYRLQTPVEQVMVHLLELELAGLVAQNAPHVYERT